MSKNALRPIALNTTAILLLPLRKSPDLRHKEKRPKFPPTSTPRASTRMLPPPLTLCFGARGAGRNEEPPPLTETEILKVSVIVHLLCEHRNSRDSETPVPSYITIVFSARTNKRNHHHTVCMCVCAHVCVCLI